MEELETSNDRNCDIKHATKAYGSDDKIDLPENRVNDKQHQFNPANFIRSTDDVNIGKINKKQKTRNKEEEKDAGIHLSAQTRVLQLKHDSDRMDKLLVIKREEYEKRMKELGARKQLLKEKRAQVKENYIKFNNYFEEMREKKEKTLERVKESQGLREQKNLEIIQ
ncbi:hypothetical protein HELRODRAFT_163384 [Helobdella robusta]|uniref:DUF4200 domain-containing protein n=1 Tax=Helobdella robusta TaxID=6412 RepID=T1ETZ4_HELRO|nr:hypothetical protein HELRODRAFT_163384 [Helobdella robusta]ESN96331.1 hypothetical protein HELRODRAFT_163384 [Helobdella robusta]